MQETQEMEAQSLGWEGLLEEGMATHSSILAWEIPWTEEPGGLHSMKFWRVEHDRVTEHKHAHTPTHVWMFVHLTQVGLRYQGQRQFPGCSCSYTWALPGRPAGRIRGKNILDLSVLFLTMPDEPTIISKWRVFKNEYIHGAEEALWQCSEL